MNKKLAIKGHSTRGKEIIELLEMMGGKNTDNADGCSFLYYTLCTPKINNPNNDKVICGFTNLKMQNSYFAIFTLEKFLEKYPYKVGDVIKFPNNMAEEIAEMKWDEELEDIIYTSVSGWTRPCHVPKNTKNKTNMSENKFGTAITILASKSNSVKLINHERERDDATFDSIITKNNENKMKNVLAELLEHIKTTPKEELYREFEEIAEWSNVGPTVEEFRTFCECVNKKSVYPKTYLECREMLGENVYYGFSVFTTLKNLIICRNAYWKIAGEQMGLNKPWEPDWDNLSTNHEFIKIDKGCFTYSSRVLVFPTEEMRDAFYENFEDLIVECKELL